MDSKRTKRKEGETILVNYKKIKEILKWYSLCYALKALKSCGREERKGGRGGGGGGGIREIFFYRERKAKEMWIYIYTEGKYAKS